MKKVFLTALLITIAKSGYVPPELEYTYAATCMSCNNASDCAAYYDGASSYTWQCVSDICMTSTCSNTSDCSSGEDCFEIPCCNNETLIGGGVSSFICLTNDTCLVMAVDMDDLNSTNSTCVSGADKDVYGSNEDAAVCGMTCPMDETSCYEPNTSMYYSTTNGGSEGMWEDCNGDFKFFGCLKVLFTDGLWYAIGGLALICLCCCGCLVLCMRKKKSADDGMFEMDNQTNHYNVYI